MLLDSMLATLILGSYLRDHISIEVLLWIPSILVTGSGYRLLHWRHLWLLDALQNAAWRAFGDWVRHVCPCHVHSFLIKLVLAARSKLWRALSAFVHLVLSSSEAKTFEVHLSESIVWSSASRLIEIFFEVRVSGSVVDYTFNIEAIIPLGLGLNSSSSVSLSNPNVWEFLSWWSRYNLRLLDYRWLRFRNVRKDSGLRRINFLFFYFWRHHYLRRFWFFLLHFGRLNFRRLRFFLFNLGRSRCWLWHVLMIDRDRSYFFALKEKFECWSLLCGNEEVFDWDQHALTNGIVMDNVFINDSQDNSWLISQFIRRNAHWNWVLIWPDWLLTARLVSLTSINEWAFLGWEPNKFNFRLRIHLCEEISIALHVSTLESEVEHVVIGWDSSRLRARKLTLLGLGLFRRSLGSHFKSSFYGYISSRFTLV